MTRYSCRARCAGRSHVVKHGSVVLMLLSLPCWIACDAPSLGNQAAAAPTSGPVSTPTPVVDDTEVLGKANLDDVEVALGDLEQPDALADPELPPPPPCVEAVRELTRQCVEQTRNIAEECIAEIVRLFQEGEVEQAHQAARACIEAINQHTEECLAALRELCHMCLAELLDHDAPLDAIEALLRSCHRAADHILHARRGAVGAIEDAVDRGVAHGCITHMRLLAADCAEQNEQTAADCVAEIEELLANGQVEEAFARAHDCIQGIRARTGECAAQIQEVSQRCLQALIRNCAAGPLIRRVYEAWEANTGLVLRSARRAVRQIRDALPPPADEPAV